MNIRRININLGSTEIITLQSLGKLILVHVKRSMPYIIEIHSMYPDLPIIDEIFQFDYLFCNLFFICIGLFCVNLYLIWSIKLTKFVMTEIFLNAAKTIHYFNKYKSHAFSLVKDASY